MSTMDVDGEIEAAKEAYEKYLGIVGECKGMASNARKNHLQVSRGTGAVRCVMHLLLCIHAASAFGF